MTSRRDIELLISAKDQTGRTFPNLVKSVGELSAKLGEQALAAERGEVALADLEKTQRDLASAAKELVQQQGLIDQFERQSKALSDAEKNAAALASEYGALKAQLASAETVTAAQERKLAGLETRSIAAAKALDLARATLATTSTSMSEAGLATANLDRQQAQLVQSATQVGTSLSVAGGLINGYEAHVRGLTTAERAATATQIGDQRLAEAAKLKQAADYTRFWTQALNDLEASEQRVAALSGFRQVGQDALEASRDISRFVESGQTMSIASNQLAAGLRAIIEPGRAATQTLNGVEAEITAAATVAGTQKLRVSEYSDALNRLSQASADLVRQGGLVDSFKQQGDAVAIARQKFEQAQAQVRQYATAVATAKEPNDQLAASLRQAEGVLEQTGRSLTQEETKLGQLSRALKTAGIDVNNLSAAEKRLTASANTAAAATSKINSSLGRNGGKAGGLFGLNPYELQNLSFQMNDVVTGLISGQKPLQILAQQGGQIAQIFPGAISAIARFALAFSPVIIAVGAVIAVLAELDSDVERVKRFSTAMAANVDGGLYDPAKLAEISEGLEIVGVKSEEAEKAVLAFVNAGADASKIEQLVTTAHEMSDVLGIDIPAATSLLINAMNGGYDATVTLDQATQTLTAAELEHVRALFDSGHAAEARQFVFDRVGNRMDELAARNRSVWQVAANNFSGAWNRLLGNLGQWSIIQGAKAQIEGLSRGVAVLAALLNGKSLDQARAEALAAQKASGGVSTLRTRLAAMGQERQRQKKIDQDYIHDLQEQTVFTDKLSKSERSRKVGLRALRDAQKAGVSDETARRAQRFAADQEEKKFDEEQSKRDAAAAGKSRTAANRASAAQRKAEAAARRAESKRQAEENRIKGIENELTGQLRQLEQASDRGPNASLEQRLHAIDVQYEKIFDTIAKLKNAGIKVDSEGRSLDEVVQIVETQKKQIANETELKYFQEQLKALEAERKDLVADIADDQERGIKTTAVAFKEVEAINNRLTPDIITAAQGALAIARTINGLHPTPEMTAFISQMEHLIAGETAPNKLKTPQADIGKEGLAQEESKLNEILSDRNNLVESYNKLVELGIMSDKEARAATADAYNRAGPALTEQTTKIKQTIELLHQQGLITDLVYDNWIARIKQVNAEAVYVDDRIRQVNQTAQEAIQRGVTQAFQTAADSIVGLISGAKSFGDVLGDVFRSGLQFAADFTKALADVLIQMIAIQAAKAIIGGSSGGLGALFFHGGGVVGSGSSRRTRNLPAAAYLGAPKFHSGGGFGLRSDEYTAILQRGEEVLKDTDPRHVNNQGDAAAGSGGGGGQSLRQVLLFKEADVAGAMAGSAGEKTFLTFVKKNASTIKQMLR